MLVQLAVSPLAAEGGTPPPRRYQPILLRSASANATITMGSGVRYVVSDSPGVAYRKLISAANAPASTQMAFTLFGVPPQQARGDQIEGVETIILDTTQVATVG